MKTKTAIIISASIVALGALAYILLKKKMPISMDKAQKMTDKELQSQMMKEYKMLAECTTNQSQATDIKKLAKCMKKHAHNGLTLAQELKKRGCAKDPSHEACKI